jgi:hypothetical protein
MRQCDIDGTPCMFACGESCRAIEALKSTCPPGVQWNFQQEKIDRAQREGLSDAPETNV